MRVAGFTRGGTLKGNWLPQAVALLARAACNRDRHSVLLLLLLLPVDGMRPWRWASAHAENNLGRAAAALGLQQQVGCVASQYRAAGVLLVSHDSTALMFSPFSWCWGRLPLQS